MGKEVICWLSMEVCMASKRLIGTSEDFHNEHFPCESKGQCWRRIIVDILHTVLFLLFALLILSYQCFVFIFKGARLRKRIK